MLRVLFGKVFIRAKGFVQGHFIQTASTGTQDLVHTSSYCGRHNYGLIIFIISNMSIYSEQRNIFSMQCFVY